MKEGIYKDLIINIKMEGILKRLFLASGYCLVHTNFKSGVKLRDRCLG